MTHKSFDESTLREICRSLRDTDNSNQKLQNIIKNSFETDIARLVIKKMALNQYDTYAFIREITETEVGKEAASKIFDVKQI